MSTHSNLRKMLGILMVGLALMLILVLPGLDAATRLVTLLLVLTIPIMMNWYQHGYFFMRNVRTRRVVAGLLAIFLAVAGFSMLEAWTGYFIVALSLGLFAVAFGYKDIKQK